MPGKTGQLYASLKASHYTEGQFTERLLVELRGGGEVEPSALFNTFENVAFARFSELSVYQEHIVKVGATDVHLAGSGPALFTLIKDRIQAEDLYFRLGQQNLETYLAETLQVVEPLEN